MNKNLFIGMFVFVFIAGVSFVSAIPLTVVSGQVFDQGANGVVGADVDIICEHLGVNTTQSTVSVADGYYYGYFSNFECDNGDTVWIHVDKDGSTGTGSAVVGSGGRCIVNTAITDVTIPEFGVVAGALALVGALGIVLYKRKD